ncbi:hypothetical protein Cgig2_029227 [Carnegiea gigantea]|uniref:Ubiquitin-like protease family profile domain-containing protein n=1 Tax=Carnegiea gigantea TaxID=171969 RepID=A0A9Q1JKJ5_9CARY|nr:hypothetical protein Cgig2_029227 [Carnegiea gigantea]
MKLRSAQEQRERPEGSNVRGECAMGEASAAAGKRKRRMSGAKLGSGDAQVSKIGEGVSNSRHTDKNGKGKGKREGKLDGGKGRNGKGREKGNVPGDGGDGVGVSGSVNDVILRSRCTLRSICALHGRLTPYQRDAVLGTVLRLVLEYAEMAMERHLTLALIQAWDQRRKAFRIGGREVRFTVFDVVLFTGLPGTGKKVELDGEEVSTEVGDMVRARMGEWERKEMARRVPKKFGKKRRFFKHYVNVMMELCEENAEEDRVGIWLRLYAFIVLSAAWSLLRYVDDVEGMGQYAWADVTWQVVVDSIEDTQRKLCRGPLSEVQLNGLCLLIQVWFYEHTTIFSNQDGQRYPRLVSWRKVDHGGMYDATELLAELQESEMSAAFMWRMESFDERLRRAREVYALEKEANRRIRAEFALMKDRLLQLEERLQEFGAGNGDAGQGAEAAGGATFSGATLTEGTSKPRGLGGAVTQDPRSPPNNVNVNLSADTEVGRTCNEDVLEQGNSDNRQNVTTIAREADVPSEPAVEGADENYEQAHPADIDDSGIASAAQSIQSATEMAAEDANSVPSTTDSVPVSDGDAVMVEQPPIAGDGGQCVADMGTFTTTHAGDDHSCRRSSNIVSRMKKVPRLRRPSRVRGLPYTNLMRRTKDGRKGLKSTGTVKTGSGHRSPSTVHGDVVNDEDVISDDVPDTSTIGPSPHVPAPRTRGTGSTFVICEEGVKAYLTWTLSPTELDLLTAVCARCKGLKDNQWNFDLPEASEKHVNAEFLKGLINVVPTRGVVDRPGRYCIGSFAVHQYCKLLHLRQRNHKRYCRMSVFLDCHDQGILSKPEHATRDIWETLKAQQDSNLCYHWLLLVADVNNRRFITYDSLQCKRDGPRKHLLLSGKVAIGLALMKLTEFTDVFRWEMEHADCPQQDNGHDCGVYVLMFMDLLSIRADGLYFGQPYVRHARDKLLLSLLQGSVAHFPQAFL